MVASGASNGPVDRAPDDDAVVRSDGLDVLGIEDVHVDARLADGLTDRAGDLVLGVKPPQIRPEMD